jgi:hypothetical protein
VNRSILAVAIALGVGAVGAPQTALAQQPAPADIEKAKAAFVAGKQAFDSGDFPEAISKFKESYNLSKNPVLLYNIGFANESAGMDDIALFYYRKFLTDAPEDAAQRAEVIERVKTLEKKFQTGGTTTAEPAKPEAPKGPIQIKPPGTYSATDFQHQMVDVAPPKKPLDITAFVPEDSGFEVTLYFRTAGEGKFTSKVMRWRYKELVGRIPPDKMLGDSVQYYIEVKDTTGAVVTRSGKSTSPNLITLEPGAPERFYPDWTDDGRVQTVEERRAEDTEEDPLNAGKGKSSQDDEDIPGGGASREKGPSNGFFDVGSTKFSYAKWGSTGAAGALLAVSAFSFFQAGSYARALEDDVAQPDGTGLKQFDSVAAGWEKTGKRYQTIHKVTLGVGIAAAAVAGFYWYKELTGGKSDKERVAGKANRSERSWVVVPAISPVGDQNTFVGAAAAAQF